MTRVLIVDDQQLLRRGLKLLLSTQPEIEVWGEADSGEQALALLADSRTKKLGSWEIAGDVLYFVIKLPDNVDAAALEAAMDIAAETADNQEIELSGDQDDL